MAATRDHQSNAIAVLGTHPREHARPVPSQRDGIRTGLRRDERSGPGAPGLQVKLLGGFRVARVDTGRLARDWSRRSAKTLVKVLATCPGHALHREQVIEILWPGADLDSALNSFGKALHAARHALEPELPPRGGSLYLRLTDGMLVLDAQNVAIDADRFERLAEDALRHQEIEKYEAALAVYSGELLPEDRYEDWCAERRTSLAELRMRLLVALADALEGRGAYMDSADRLRQVVSEDPTREEVHRRLIRLWAEMGNRDQAVRQFHVCQEALRRDLDLTPQRETVSLYQDVLANRIPARRPRRERDDAVPDRRAAPAAIRATPLVGRERLLESLMTLLEHDDERAPMLLLTGEAGIGKTRVLETFAGDASRIATVLRGEVGAHVSHLPYGPMAVALESFVAARSENERQALARRHPALTHLVPSLAFSAPAPSLPTARIDHLDLLLAIVRVLTDLTSSRPLLLVVDDVHEADPLSLDVLRYFAHLGRPRGWLVVAAVREAELSANSAVARALESMLREGLCTKLELAGLPRGDSDQLVRALAGGERITDDLARQVHDRSGGNPLFIEALVAELLERRAGNGVRRLSPQSSAHLPPRVRSLVTSQLRALDETGRRVLSLAAAAETAEVSLERLLAAAAALEAPIGPAQLFDALDQALSLRILEDREGGYAFRHPLVRTVLCQELSSHRRAELQAAWCRPEHGRSRRLRGAAAR